MPDNTSSLRQTRGEDAWRGARGDELRPRLDVAPPLQEPEPGPTPPRTLREAGRALAERRAHAQAGAPAAAPGAGHRTGVLTPTASSRGGEPWTGARSSCTPTTRASSAGR